MPGQKTNNGPQNTAKKTRGWAIQTQQNTAKKTRGWAIQSPLRTRDELRYSDTHEMLTERFSNYVFWDSRFILLN